MTGADGAVVPDDLPVAGCGASAPGEEVDSIAESEPRHGFLPGDATAALYLAGRTWTDFRKMRVALALRYGITDEKSNDGDKRMSRLKAVRVRNRETLSAEERWVHSMLTLERNAAARVAYRLRKHVLWSGFLDSLPGLGGSQVGYFIGKIGSFHRFPGQPCSGYTDSAGVRKRHTLNPICAVGAPCPVINAAGTRCPGVMFPPRAGTGAASIVHWCGLHVRAESDGQWDREACALLLGDGGIADLIVMHDGGLDKRGNPTVRNPYRDVYDKKRSDFLARAEDAQWMPWLAARQAASEKWTLKGWAHWTAKKVAVKELVKDLLREGKRRCPLDISPVSEKNREGHRRNSFG